MTDRISASIFYLLLTQFLNAEISTGGQIPGLEVTVPPSHIALSGDLNFRIISSSFLPLVIHVSRLEETIVRPLTTFPVYPEAKSLSKNLTIVKIPCGYFSQGGQYYVNIKKQRIRDSNTSDSMDSEVITKMIDVRWPTPQLTVTPVNLKTYPENPVTSILTFSDVDCAPVKSIPPSTWPEFWLELQFCGHSLLNCENGPSLDHSNKSNHQVLFSEQVRGLPRKSVFKFRCELFGLSGHYSIVLRPTSSHPAIPRTSAYIKVDWSDQFVFNVHAHSIFPCDTHSGGVTVLFQYPSCILATGDRVRLFARLRANVASLAPPTALEYISEKKVDRGQHSLHFDCDLFTERYVEYCFVYVSKSISGAVADVREDCVPTLPVSDQERGGWSSWSQWTPCSSTCVGGIRSRYRLCDNPPPRYGAKFCEGPAVETEECGFGLGSSWECIYSGAIAGSSIVPANIPEIQAEVGQFCRCGCVVHLGRAKPRRLLATSSQSCPGRTFWLIQADSDCIIQFRVDQFSLPCGSQWLKIRDGSSLSSKLLSNLVGQPGSVPSIINSTGPDLLLEFYSSEIAMENQICDGGFLAEASQIKTIKLNVTDVLVSNSMSSAIPVAVLKLTAVHIAAIFFLGGLVIATSFLGIQYMFRYRKYQVAQFEDHESLTASNINLQIQNRAQSNSTLLSEVISITRMTSVKLKGSQIKHRKLRECDHDDEEKVGLAKEDLSVSGSTATLTARNETTVARQPTLANPESDDLTPTGSLTTSPDGQWRIVQKSGTLTEKDESDEKDINSTETDNNVPREFASIVLTNGCYSSVASMVSMARIRSTNAKATKDKRNREKLLAGPGGSELSIAAPENDLEIDYYDYNVVNAGAAPGSYLGMDPAFLVWIPPLDETGEILPPDTAECHEMADIRPKVYIDPGSNKESPEEDILWLKPRRRSLSDTTVTFSPVSKKKNKIPLPLVHGVHNTSVYVDNKYLNDAARHEVDNKRAHIQMHDFPKILRELSYQNMEKETKVEKCLSPNSNITGEIRFADDDFEEIDFKETQRTIESRT